MITLLTKLPKGIPKNVNLNEKCIILVLSKKTRGEGRFAGYK